MADDKLGTLEYEMKISEVELTKSLERIDDLLKLQNDKWQKALSNVGGAGNFNIDTSKLVTANKAVQNSIDQISGSIKDFRIKARETWTEYEALEDKTTESAKAKLALYQEQKFKLSELGAVYRKLISEERDGIRLTNKLKAEANRAEVYWNQQGMNELVKNKNLAEKTHQDKLKQVEAEVEAQKKFEQEAKNAGTKRAFEESERQRKESEKRIAQLKKEADAQAQALNKIAIRYNVAKSDPITRLDVSNEYLKKKISYSTDNAEIKRLNLLIDENNKKRQALIATQRQQEQQEKTLFQQQKLQAGINAQAEGSIGRLRAQLALYVFQLGQITTKTPNATAEIKRLQTAIADTKNGIAAMQPTLGLWGKLVSAIRTYATAYLSVQAVMGLGRAVFTQTKELDQLAFSMATVIKSSTELAQTQKFLSDVAINYGGDLLTLSERYIKFRAAAMQSNISAGETQKIYDSVSKAAGTLGLKTDELSGVYLALEQMISKGKVTTEELRRQLGERLPGAFGIMANALGVTIPQLDKMLKKGEVLSKDALPKFAAALEKAYGIESLKKIDTLAAAQGRMSTQFTGLIKAVGASDSFKSVINGIANFIGFIKDNIGVIGFFAKAITAVSAALLLQKVRLALIVPLQTAYTAAQIAYVFVTGKAVVATTRLTAAQIQATLAMRASFTAATALKGILSVMGGWWGIALTAIAGVVSYFTMFRKETKEVVDEITQLNKQLAAQKATVNGAADSLAKAEKGSNLYKESLQQLNNIGLKFNQTLLTEKSNIDEINTARERTILLLDREYNKKRKVVETETAETKLNSVLDPLKESFYAKFSEDSDKASRAFNKFLDEVRAGKNAFQVTDYFGKDITKNAILGIREFEKELKRIDKAFGKEIDIVAKVDISELPNKLKSAKEEFENIVKIGAKDSAPLEFFDTTKGIETYKDYLNSLLAEYNTVAEKMTFEEFQLIPDVKTQTLDQQKSAYEDYTNVLIENAKQQALARKTILVELADLEKKDSGDNKAERLLKKRNEAIDELNKKYLQDKEDFVNADLGISAGRIAALEDGIAKEQKLNQLSYENRIKAINKEREAGLKLVNEIAGTEKKPLITSLGFDASGYSKEVQTALANLLETDTEKRANATRELTEKNLAIVIEFEDKIKEIQRDVNDEFLTGLQKEKAAIKEKYDDWEKRARLAAPGDSVIQANILKARRTAEQELEKNFQLDQLDFAREIEYQKNEIRVQGFNKQRILEQENFLTYVKFEQERAKILKSSVNKDKQLEGLNIEQRLALEKILFGLSQEEESRNKILESAKQLSIVLIDILGLTQAESAALNGMVDIANELISKGLFDKGGMDLSSGDKFQLAMSGATTILTTILNQTKANKLSQEEWNKTITEGAHQLSLLNIEALAYKEANIFGVEDPYARATAGALRYGAAMGELVNAAQKLELGKVQIGLGKEFSTANILGGAGGGAAIGAVVGSVIPGLGTLIGAGIGFVLGGITTAFAAKKTVPIFESLKKKYGEIYDKDTFELNPKILEDYDKLDESTKNLVDNWKDIKDAAIDAQEEMKSNFQELAGSLGDSLSESLIEAFKNNDLYSAIDSFHDKVGDVIASIIQQMLFAQFFQKFFDKAQEGFNNSFGMITDSVTGKLRAMTADELAKVDSTGKKIADLNIVDDIDTLTTDIVKGVDGYSKAMDEADRQLIAKGYAGGLRGSSSIDDKNSISKGIQGVTEDTDRRLEGLINSIRETGVKNMGNTKEMLAVSQMTIQAINQNSDKYLVKADALLLSSQMIQAYSGQSLAKLTNIDNNIAMQLALFNGIMTNASGVGGQGLKVYIQ